MRVAIPRTGWAIASLTGEVVCGRNVNHEVKRKVPPLRFAPVGMTEFRD